MIENLSELARWLAIRKANLRSLLGVSHRHVRTLSDQGIELRDLARGENLSRERKQQIRVVIASLVGNDRQHAGPRCHLHERAVQNVAQFSRRKISIRRALS